MILKKVIAGFILSSSLFAFGIPQNNPHYNVPPELRALVAETAKAYKKGDINTIQKNQEAVTEGAIKWCSDFHSWDVAQIPYKNKRIPECMVEETCKRWTGQLWGDIKNGRDFDRMLRAWPYMSSIEEMVISSNCKERYKK